MTLGTQTSLVERLSRSAGANTIATASDVTKIYLNEGVREFSKKVHGLAAEAFISLAPKFDIGTDWAIKFTLAGNVNTYGSADIPIASSALDDATPTTVLGNIVSNVNATIGSMTISMGWSPSTWTFQFYGPASATSIVFSTPTDIRYTNALPFIFGNVGGSLTKAGSITITGNIPQDVNLVTSLPAGFLEMNFVFYGQWQVRKAPAEVFLRPRTFGVPNYYDVKNKQIFFWPTPISQDFFKIFYSAMPVDLGVDGSSDSVSCPLPEENHMAPVYYAAAKILEESHEYQKAVYNMQLFTNMCSDYRMREANNQPSLFPSRNPYIPPGVK